MSKRLANRSPSYIEEMLLACNDTEKASYTSGLGIYCRGSIKSLQGAERESLGLEVAHRKAWETAHTGVGKFVLSALAAVVHVVDGQHHPRPRQPTCMVHVPANPAKFMHAHRLLRWVDSTLVQCLSSTTAQPLGAW